MTAPADGAAGSDAWVRNSSWLHEVLALHPEVWGYLIQEQAAACQGTVVPAGLRPGCLCCGRPFGVQGLGFRVIDVFGCEVDLIELDTQLPLPEAFHTALLQQKKLQIVVRPCMVEGHSIWQFQADDRESYPIKPYESLSIHAEKLLTEPFTQHLCSDMWKLLQAYST